MKIRCQKGFALPSILIVSTIMFAVLVFAVASVSSVRTSLMTEYYNQMAREASAAGVAYAKSCLANNNGVPTWNDTSPLGPGTDCSGAQLPGLSCVNTTSAAACFVVSGNNVRSTFSVGMPKVDANGKATTINSVGTVDLVRNSNNSIIWRTYNQNTYEYISTKGIVTSGLSYSFDAGNISSYPKNGTSWFDVSPSSNSGSMALVGGVGYSASNGGVLTFDGSNDYGTLNNTVAAYSVEMWVKPSANQSATYQTYYNQGAQSLTSGFWWIYTDSNSATMQFQYTNGAYTSGGSMIIASWNNAVTYDQWNHFVFVLNPNVNTVTLFKNGVSLGSAVFSNELLPSGTFYVGTYQAGSNYLLKGSIASVNIYSRSLTDAEVSQNFNALRSRFGL